MITSLRIQNYRQFEDLTVEGLKRLNLIVGENGVGKSALLEALWLHVNEGSKDVLFDILALRGETISPGLHAAFPDDISRSPFSSFTPWPPDNNKLLTSFTTCTQHNAIKGFMYRLALSHYKDGDITYSSWFNSTNDGSINEKEIYDEGYRLIGEFRILHDHSSDLINFLPKRRDNVFVPFLGLSNNAMNNFWGKVALTPFEDVIVQALNLIKIQTPVLRTSIVDGQAKVLLDGAPGPVPLKRLGDGMTRLFALALAMVNAKGGVLLIDEIETGMHRATLARMWPFLFTLAEQLDVQLFATTHSWDCIAAFAAAAKATPADDGALVRLERRDGKIIAVSYDEATLAEATEDGIEVR